MGVENSATLQQRPVIGRQLAVGFGVFMLLLVALGGVAVHRVNSIADSLAVINDINSVKQRFAINFRGSVHDRAISLRDVVLVTDARERAAALAEIERLVAFYAASATPLDRMMATGAEVTAAETQILASIKATEARTMPIIAAVIEAAQRGDGAKAHSLLLEQARPGFIEWLARINQFIDLQEEKNRGVAQVTRGVADGFQTLMLGLVAIGLALGGAVAFWSLRAMAPLRRLATTMLRLAQGEHQAEIPGLGRRDEVGTMAKAVAVFRTQGEEAERLRAAQEAERAAARQAQSTALRGMADRVEEGTLAAMGQIADQAKNLAADAEAMAAATARVDRNTDAVGSAATDQLMVAETVAAAAEELTASIRSIAQQVRETAEVSRGTAADSTRTEQVIVALSSAVGEIGDVTNLIQEIAGKTNLLALNATIEAARAGDAGKGFAVVAGEVKDLAAQTAKATQEIGKHIEEVRSRTEAAVETVQRIARSVSRMDELAGSLADAVSGQDAATQEIARSIAGATQAAREVTQRIGEVSADAREAGAKAATAQSHTAQLASNADALTKQVVSILRTSVSEVDRRTQAREPISMDATLELDGRQHRVRVVDQSPGGLGLVTELAVRVGQRGSVTLSGRRPRPVEVRHGDGGRYGLAFLDAGQVPVAA